jgi:AraC-like DNA-binding protein
MEEIRNISFEQILQNAGTKKTFDDDFLLFEVMRDNNNAKRTFSLPVRLDAFVYYICIDGEVSFTLNYTDYKLTRNTMLLVNKLHVVDNPRIIDRFTGYFLVVSQAMTQSLSDDMKDFKWLDTINPRAQALTHLSDAEMHSLITVIESLTKMMNNSDHPFRRQIIRHYISIFILEAAKIRLDHTDCQADVAKPSRNEAVMRDFLRLVLTSCREQHDVSFYADSLCMTVGNLTRIVKAASGKSANKWLADAIVTEARILLRKPNVLIQEVSDELSFANQTTFGRFFRHHTGMTPKEYRQQVRM